MDKSKWTLPAMGLAFALAVVAVAAGNRKSAAVAGGKGAIAQAGTAGTASASPAGAANPAVAAARADIAKTLGFVPQFLGDMPDAILPGLWDEFKNLQMNANTALPKSTKELIGLGVAAQIPCHYCVEAHREFAKLGGANDRELGEAVSVAAITRHWSTFLNGTQIDEAKFRGELRKAMENMKKSPAPAPGAPGAAGSAQKGNEIVDGRSALKDIEKTYGFVPEFLRRFPDVARAGAWRSMKDVEMGPTALMPKYKDLIELGVASQIPCSYCVVAATEFAKSDGASEAELTEAVAVASFTREMSTMLNGLQVDETQFRADIARLVKASQAAAGNPGQTAAPR